MLLRFNDPTAHDRIVVIEHRCLARTNPLHGLFEHDPRHTGRGWSDLRLNSGGTITNLHRDPARRPKLVAVNKIQVRYHHLPDLQLGRFSENHAIRVWIYPDNIQPLSGCNTEMSSLPHGEKGDAVVFSHDCAVGQDHLAGTQRLRRMFLQKSAVIIVWNKADLLTFGPLRGGEGELARQGANLGLSHTAEGKENVPHLVLSQPVEEIALVLALIRAFFQKIPGRSILFHARVMAGRKMIKAVRFRVLEKMLKLDKVVALDAGIGGASPAIFADKIIDNGSGKLGLSVNHAVRDAEAAAYCLGGPDVAAESGRQLHGDAFDLKPLPHEERGGHRTVDPPAHGHENALVHNDVIYGLVIVCTYNRPSSPSAPIGDP